MLLARATRPCPSRGAPPSWPSDEPARQPEEGGARQEPAHDGEGPLLDLFVAENTGQQKEVHAQ
jgi:hypothetical protein